MDVFNLFAKLSLDSSEYEQGLTDAEKKGSNFGSGLLTAGKVAGGAVLAVGTAVAGVTTALVKDAGEVASYGDNIDKMSQKIGISAEAYQEWDAILQHSGASISSLQPAMKTLATQAQTGSDAFAKLGISEEKVASLSQEDLFAEVIAGLQNMEEGTERTYIASQLLGRGATELGALLNTSAEDTETMRKRVHELNGVLSDEGVKAAAGFQDSLQDMQTAFTGIKNKIFAEFLPALSGVMDGLTEIFAGNYDEGADKIGEAFESIVEKLTESLPRILEVGVNIVKTLATAILENIPVLLPTLVQLVMDIGKFIIENLPLLLQTALQIVAELAKGIIDALPELIPAVVDIILQIVETMIDNIDMLVDAAIQLIIALAEGLIKALPILIEKIPVIIVKLVEAIIRNLPKILEAGVQLIVTLVAGIVQTIPKVVEGAGKLITAFVDGIKNTFSKLADIGRQIIEAIKNAIFGKIKEAATWGKDLIDNFVGGITSKISNVTNAVKGIGDKIKGLIGFSEPTDPASPLHNFHTFAPDMMELFTKGIADNEDMLYNQIKDTFDFGDAIKADTAIGGSGFGSGGNDNRIISLLEQLVAKESVVIEGDADKLFTINRIISLLEQLVAKESVVIEGDADKLFTITRKKNNEFKKANGVSAFA